ncbi:MAG: histidine kinase [Vicingaceae bacterium]
MRYQSVICSFLLVMLFSKATLSQELFFQHYSVKEGLRAQVITSIEFAEGQLYIGTDRGLFVRSGSERFKEIVKDKSGLGYITRLGKTQDENLWIADENGRLYSMNGGVLSNTNFPKGFVNLLNQSIIDQIDRVADYWFVSLVIGAGIYKSNETKWTRLEDTTVKSRFVIMELPNGGLVSGVMDENLKNDLLTVLFRDGHRLEFILSEGNQNSKSLSARLSKDRQVYSRGREVIIFNDKGVIERKFFHANVEHVMEDQEGKIWIGFAEGGLHCFPTGELSSNNFSRYLGRTTVHDMVTDQLGDLWFATSQGLYSLPRLEEAEYSPPDFLRESSASIKKKDNSFKMMQEKEVQGETIITINDVLPKAVISGIRVNMKDTVLQDLYQLGHNENLIEVEFAGLINNRPEAVQFKYKLSGKDTAWTYSTVNKSVYQGLEPGTYNFYVYAQSKQGSWSENPGSLAFIIAPPFYKTQTFYVLILIGLGFVIILVILLLEQLKRRNRMKEEEFKKRVLQSELQALRAQMNPHFTFNTLSSIQNYISKNDGENASKYLSKFAKLIRMIMENAKQTDVPLEDEMNALKLYLELESLRLRDKFDYKIEVDKEIDQQYTRIPSMLIQPYVENAIWHGITNKEGKGRLTVEVIKNGSYLKCIIDDDGIGRKAAMKISEKKKKHISHGMSITSERLDLMNSLNQSDLNVRIEDKMNGSHAPTGTRVEIFIPLKDD